MDSDGIQSSATGQRPLNPPSATLATVSPGIPEHELIRLIGSGSYGEVWLGRSTLGVYRAIKIVYRRTFRHAHPFEREFKGVQNFEPISRLHDGLIDILQVGSNEAYFYCVMELADDVIGGRNIDPKNYQPHTLASACAGQPRFPLEECRRIGVIIARAADFVHSRGLIHRDIKPSSIVFVNGTPKLADIGLVAEMSEAQSYVGTDGFIPPEGPGTVRADVYSLGKVLYEISTGKDRHEFPALPRLPDCPAEKKAFIEFNRIILKACRTKPHERYKSANAMAIGLEQWGNGTEESRKEAVKRQRRQLIKVCATLFFIGLLGMLLWFAWAVYLTGSGRAAPVPFGLVSWWRAEGDCLDVMGQNPGTVTSAVSWGEGRVGRSFVFNGPGSAVRLGNPANLRLQNLTVEAWIKRSNPTNATMDGIDCDFLGYGYGGYGFGLNNNGNLFFGKIGVDAVVAEGVMDTNFHHVAVTKSGKQVVFYVDGIAHPAAPYGTAFDFNTSVAIGARGDNLSGSFYGSIDELSVYDRSLSANEIRRIYRAGAAGKSTVSLSGNAH